MGFLSKIFGNSNKDNIDKNYPWIGEVPSICELCGNAISDVFYDGHVKGKPLVGGWNFMCPECFDIYGSGLGIGVGQKFVKSENDRFYLAKGGEKTEKSRALDSLR
ncbi:MAG: hypothetical protein R2941_23710 [Desulfobacterales bacterium]